MAIPPEIILEIWRWSVDTIGMGASVILALAVLIIIYLLGRKICLSIKGNNNTVVNGSININTTPQVAAEPRDDTTPLSQRNWEEHTGYTEHIEKSAGFRATGPIYRTQDTNPRYYILNASPRVYNWEGEDHYDSEGSCQFILLEEPKPGQPITRKHINQDAQAEQKRLEKLYRIAKEKSQSAKMLAVQL